jgi:PIN domain nuclease of toxin-antitoxin system
MKPRRTCLRCSSARRTVRMVSLPVHHRDPFDRLLVAQAQLENLPILTGDRAFRLYDVEVLAA